MGLMNTMMEFMVGRMDKNEKEAMMDRMMDKMLGDFTAREKRKRHGNRIFFHGSCRVIMDPIVTPTDEDSDDRTQDRRRSDKIQAPLADTRQGPGKERLEPGGILPQA